jgi:hypothetical protein
VTWSFYDQKTGEILSRTYSGPQLDINTPPGTAAIEGVFDSLSQRIDLETLAVVDYQPPQPDADHEWNAETRRWIKKAEVIASEQKDRAARVALEDIDARSIRRLRELSVSDPQLAALESEAVEFRKDLVADLSAAVRPDDEVTDGLSGGGV